MPPSPHITYLGETNYRNERKRFEIKQHDRRRHCYILGKTGTGKSTLLENMTVADMAAGHGVAVLDPHGDYAERMLDFVLCRRLLGRPVSECGRLCHGEGGHEGGDRAAGGC